jgi:hypothetical protein
LVGLLRALELVLQVLGAGDASLPPSSDDRSDRQPVGDALPQLLPLPELRAVPLPMHLGALRRARMCTSAGVRLASARQPAALRHMSISRMPASAAAQPRAALSHTLYMGWEKAVVHSRCWAWLAICRGQ